MGSSRRVRGSRGMTLVEVIIAAMVLAIAIFGLVSTLFYTSRQEGSCHEVSIALSGIRAKIEEVRSQRFQDAYSIYLQDASRHFEIPGLVPQETDTDIYSPHRTGEVIVAVTSPNLLRVTVRASWTGILGDQSIEMTSEMTDRRKEGL